MIDLACNQPVSTCRMYASLGNTCTGRCCNAVCNVTLIQGASALSMLDVWIVTGCAVLALLGCHRSRSVVSVSTPSVCALPPPPL